MIIDIQRWDFIAALSGAARAALDVSQRLVSISV
jgi:hypothetical protein